MDHRGSLYSLLLVATACGGGGGGEVGCPGFGLSQRVPVQGLTFPNGLPQPTAMQPVLAFPNLSFNRPVFLATPPDGTDRIFVVEQDGLIRVFANDPNVASSGTFLDIRSQVSRASNEEGLLGFAFHPGYDSNGLFYTYYSVASPRRSILSRWTVSGGDANLANPGIEQILLSIDEPFGNHNGGSLAFGPDGMLYVAVGDGGSGGDPQNNAQNLGNLLGKILRLDSDAGIPADNPFVGGIAGERGEIWAYGLRNPWRSSFDRATGDLWVGDVGQNAIEEVDLILRGGNYGWRIYEGDQPFNNPNNDPPTAFMQPVHTYTHADGISITGGYVYRGSQLTSLIGSYLYADFGSGRVWALVYDDGQVISNQQVASVTNPASFGEDQAGEIYICSFDGNIYALEEVGPGGGGSFPSTLSATGLFSDVVSLTPAQGVIEYDVRAPLWSDGAVKRRWMALPGTARIGFDSTDAWAFPAGTVLVKHFEIEISPGQLQRLETRVLLHHDTGWQGYTYRWNANQTEADLLSGSATEVLTVTDPGGGTRLQTWYYPSGTDCMSCHTAAAGRVLGLRTQQTNGDFDYPVMRDNQLRALNHIGLFDSDLGAADQYAALADPVDLAATVTERARAYLEVNCANCHRPGGPTPVDLDLRAGIPISQMNAVGIPSQNPINSSGVRIVAGNKELSELWERMRRRDSFGMPPLGSNRIDQAAIDLIGEWIDTGAGNFR